MNKIKIKDRYNNDNLVDAKFITLDKHDLNRFMEFQEKIIQALDNKELYAPTTISEYLDCLEKPHYILGIENLSNNELIAVGIYLLNGLDEENYGYDLDFPKEDLLKTSQILSTLVSPQFRGNKLQQLICEKFIETALIHGDKYITATVSPINPYSLNTFLALGFKVEKEKLKYGGLRRYVLSKNLLSDN
ncbi:GNAT family N-acetyltransferase [Clostridium sp.]|uniref:GNAT family N-acetyltransferase n=1 Tax=Clostridium sp. TaxID=1506 RepID=UPI003992B61A